MYCSPELLGVLVHFICCFCVCVCVCVCVCIYLFFPSPDMKINFCCALKKILNIWVGNSILVHVLNKGHNWAQPYASSVHCYLLNSYVLYKFLHVLQPIGQTVCGFLNLLHLQTQYVYILKVFCCLEKQLH
jgi:hypothetical protein